MNESYLWFAISFACFAGFLAQHFYRQVVSMAGATVLPQPKLENDFLAVLPDKTLNFLEQNHFAFDGAYVFQNVRFAVWTQVAPVFPLRRFVFMESGGKLAHDFVTEFSEEDSLTTGMTRASFSFPRPWGSFLQSFPGQPLPELWLHHTQGEKFLIESESVRTGGPSRSIEDTLSKAMPRQLAHVRSYSLWPVRALYWFFIKRFLSHNVPISSQNLKRAYRK